MKNRLDLFAWLTLQEGKPYTWGAKGPEAFDCSGLVTAGLYEMGLPDWRETHNAARLMRELPKVKTPSFLDLCFYGPNGNATHVMLYIGGEPVRVYGACGGGSATTSAEIARAHGARVRFRTGVNYRPDLLGFRALPLPPGPEPTT